MPKSKHRDATRDQRLRTGEAIREARGGLTQAELGARIGEAQTTLSRWEGGEVELELSQARRIEDALDLTPGWIGRRAGFFDTDELHDEVSDTLIRVGYFDSFEDALGDVKAAQHLGLGVRMTNRSIPHDDEGCRVEEWVVTLYTETVEVD